MNYLEAKNPVWASVEHDAITLNVIFEKLGEVPFAATPNDTEPHGRELFARAVAGDFGPIADYVAPPEPEPYVPVEVEGWQAEVAMRITNVDPDDEESQTVWDRVQDLIAAMPDGIEKITVQTALARGKIRRDSASLAQLAPLVPLSESRVDDLLILADSIQA